MFPNKENHIFDKQSKINHIIKFFYSLLIIANLTKILITYISSKWPLVRTTYMRPI
jgi:hypothetical protein